MRFPFLTPSAERVGADGRVEQVHEGGALGRFRPRVTLLARDLCTFQLFEAGALPRGRRRQAALLFARTASPYVVGGMVIVPAGQDFGVWWWDLERVSALLTTGASTTVVRPETLAQPTGEGWRIVRLKKGFDAQLWRGGKLLASSWRAQPFDAASWLAFARLQRDGADAPATPPTPVILPIADDSEAFAFSGAEMTPRQAAIATGGAAAFAILLGSLFLVGQGLRLAEDRKEIEAEVATIRAALPAAANAQAQEADRRRLATYAEIEGRTNPLTSSGAALGILALYEIEPTNLEVEAETLTVKIPYTAIDSIDELVSEFETSGFFEDVEPRTDIATSSLTIAMKVRPAAAPLGSAG
ncbi:hypothetical protein [Brevundimonas sp.]